MMDAPQSEYFGGANSSVKCENVSLPPPDTEGGAFIIVNVYYGIIYVVGMCGNALVVSISIVHAPFSP